MFTQAKHHYILMLATLSGVCGIAYEILYARMLSTYFGDIFYVTAAILVGFLASIGIGALVAHRYAHYLPYIEVGIGAYGLLAAYVFSNQAASLVQFVTSITATTTPAALVSTVLILLAVPAVLIGFSIPLFTIYLSYYRPRDDASAGFRHTYLFYNLGAAVAILVIEFALIHLYGITASVVSVAFINFIIGFALLRIPAPRITPEAYHKKEGDYPNMRYMGALLLASVGSGIFQLLFLKVTHSIFGPLNENFAIVVATVFAGMAFGAFLANTFNIRFMHLLLASAVVTILTFLIVEPVIHLWAYLQSAFIVTVGVSAFAKTGVLVLWSIAAFTLFGAAIPILLRECPGNYVITPGRTLAVSAFGNALGFLSMIFILHEHFSEPMIAIIVAVLFLIAAALFLSFRTNRIEHIFSASVVIIAMALPMIWPVEFLHAGFERIRSQEAVSYIEQNIKKVETYRNNSDTAHILTFVNGDQWFTHNGNSSLRIPREGENFMILETTIAGIAPALFSHKRDNALVIGLGAGITAGATAQVYDSTHVVDVNSALPPVVARFSDENFDVLEMPNTSVEIQDGVVELIEEERTYDAIVATVASAAYYPANKLRTRNTYELIKQRLADGGVYSSWFSARLGYDGVRTTIKTLEESFADCRYMFFIPGLLNVVCGTEELTKRSLSANAWPESIKERLIVYGIEDIEQYLTDIIISGDVSPISEEVPVNTFDYPVLEFTDTLSRAWPDKRAMELLRNFAISEFMHLPFTNTVLSQKEIERRCRHINILVAQTGYKTKKEFPMCSD